MFINIGQGKIINIEHIVMFKISNRTIDIVFQRPLADERITFESKEEVIEAEKVLITALRALDLMKKVGDKVKGGKDAKVQQKK